MPSLTTAAARDLDRRAIDEFGIPGLVLMENAARNLAELLASLRPAEPLTILCGPGNNGGDGLAMGRHLDRLGLAFRLLLFGDKLSPQTVTHWDIAQRCGFDRTRANPDDLPDLGGSGWIVDALFGSGLNGPLRSGYGRIVEAVNACGRPVFAVDVPSGFDADAGRPTGPCVRAAHTAVTVAPRVGFAVPGAEAWLGRVHVVDIGLPTCLLPRDETARVP